MDRIFWWGQTITIVGVDVEPGMREKRMIREIKLKEKNKSHDPRVAMRHDKLRKRWDKKRTTERPAGCT